MTYEMRSMAGLATLFGIALTNLACVESDTLPALPPQTQVAYGDIIYLRDDTRNSAVRDDWCTRFFAETATVGEFINQPHNCFVQVEPVEGTTRVINVDQVEVTNDLYQFCVDSGACLEPDPSKDSPDQLCNNADEFDQCPVVDVSQENAGTFCRWIGRRLPTSFEHIVIRQAALSQPITDPTTITDYINGNEAPDGCEEAVLRTPGCMAAKPRPVLDGNDNPAGGGRADSIPGIDNAPIYDLTGNLAEWTADLFPNERGNAEGYPWFCTAALPARTSTAGLSAQNPPLCPTGAQCIFGRYQPSDDLPLDIYPVCITTESGRFSGNIAALFGGSYADTEDTPEFVGTFGRRTQVEPQNLTDTAVARQYGFRCVGDRASINESFSDVFRVVPYTP